MGGWLDLVGCGDSNPRIQRCRILVVGPVHVGIGELLPERSLLGLLPIITQNESDDTSWAGQVTWVKCTNLYRVYNLID